jgi:hypothetical protein
MTKRIVRIALLSLTLLMTLAGSINSNRAKAEYPPLDSDCYSCLGGPYVCRHAPVGQRCYSEDPYLTEAK